MNWLDYATNYDEAFPHKVETPRRIVETNTGDKEDINDEVVDEPIIESETTVDIDDVSDNDENEVENGTD